MGKAKTTLGAALVVLAWVLAAGSAQADGKIFMNGKWHTANTESTVAAPLRGLALPQLLPNANWSSINLAQSFIKANHKLLGATGASRFESAGETSSEALQTVRMKQTWNGIQVVGGEVLVHSKNGVVQFASGDSIRFDGLDATPSVNAKTAASIAFASYEGNAADVKKNELKIVVVPYDSERVPHLAHAVTVRDRDGLSSDIHYIDAHTGQELFATTNVHTIRQRKVMSAQGNDNDFELDTSKYDVIYHENNCRNGKCRADKAADVMKSAEYAWDNSGMVYDYYNKKHARESIDNGGMEIRSVVNFGEKFSNAAWVDDYGIMIYGMGDNEQYNDFASALDVAAHELTHGVTAKTARLEYVAESGALNESYSDVFGKLVAFDYGKTDDWRLGKELFKDGKGAIRDMRNPLIGHVRDYRFRGEFCSRFNDWCGVHSNSGIPNRAAVMLSDEIGREKVGKIYYLTLTQLLKANSGFSEARAQTEAACATLYGERSRECQSVSRAFSEVGIELAAAAE